MSIRVMSDVLDHAPVSGSKLLVLVALANFADDDGACWPSMPTIAAKARISERSAQRACRDMADAGLIEIDASAGPNGVNRYRVICAAFRRKNPAEASGGGDRMSPPDAAEWGDTGVTGGVTNATPGGDTGVTRTVIEPSDNRQEREGAGARPDLDGEAQDVDPQQRDDPKLFARRVKRLEMGSENDPWPGSLGSSTKWATDQFAKLTDAERLRAEERRDGYLAECRRTKTRPVALGVYFRDRKFDDVTGGEAGPAVPKRPDGYAPPFGPVWAARLHALLLAGPDHPDKMPDEIAVIAGEAFWMANDLRTAWPSLAAFANGGGRVLAPQWHALKDAVEFVPASGAAWAAWRDEFARRGWPWPKAPAGMDGLYFPKGGPDGLDAFGAAVRQAGSANNEGKAA